MNKTIRTARRRLAACSAAVLLGAYGATCSAADAPAMPAMTAPPAGAYHIDMAHASLQFRVNHMGFSTYTSRFSRFDASLTFDPSNIPASKLVATVDATSLQMDDAPKMCTDIVQGPQLLDTKQFPKIVYRSEKVRMTGSKSFEILGTLELHGVTRPLVLTGTYNGGYSGMADMDPQARIGFSAHGTFKRSDFGMGYGIPAPGTTVGVGDEINISIEVELLGPPLKAAAGKAS